MSDALAEAKALWAGVDLGGTGTRMVVADSSGGTHAVESVPTRSFAGSAPDDAASLLVDALLDMIPSGSGLVGVGIGASGPVDLTTGVINNPDTLPWFSGIDLVGLMADRMGLPVWIDNDAVVAGLAESTWGAGAGHDSVLCVTLGTGIGVALIEGGQPRRGGDGQHPEGGHIAVGGTGSPCYCGLDQCWEQVASRSALDRLMVRHGLEPWADAPREVWAEYASQLTRGLITHTSIQRPSAVVISGSVVSRWDHLREPLLTVLANRDYGDRPVEVLPGTMGDEAGALRRIGHASSGATAGNVDPR
jgi:glucokinase